MPDQLNYAWLPKQLLCVHVIVPACHDSKYGRDAVMLSLVFFPCRPSPGSWWPPYLSSLLPHGSTTRWTW